MPLKTNFDHADYSTPREIEFEAMDAPAVADPILLTRAILFGLFGAIAGALIDAAFIGVTHINLGYIALLIAFLVAKAMTIGSRGQGGLSYQISALFLTYLSVAMAHAALLYWDIHRSEHVNIPLTSRNILLLAKYGVEEPFLGFQHSVLSALIGLFILFLAMRAAWRMTSGISGAVRHPFAR